MDLNKERKLALNLFTGNLFRQISWCIIIEFSRNISIIAESIYRDIIIIVSHVSWLYRIVRYSATPTPTENSTGNEATFEFKSWFHFKSRVWTELLWTESWNGIWIYLSSISCYLKHKSSNKALSTLWIIF